MKYQSHARLRRRQLRQPHDALDRHHRRCCSSSGTSPTSRGAGSTPTSCGATVYRNVDASLVPVPVAILYIVANIALGIHLFHGAWSLFQSMGWNNPRFNPWRRGFATGIATRHRGRQRLVPDRRPGRHRRRSEAGAPRPMTDVTARRQESPPARSPRSGTRTRSTRSWSTRTTSASSRSSSSAPAWPARRRRPRWPSSATRSRRSRSTTRPGGPTRSPPRAASTRPRTTGATATRSTACSTTRSRAATSAPARPTSTAWPRCRSNIIDQMVAQGVPFAREYGGLLDNRSFGGAQVSRTFYARGQTGQQLLLGAYQQLARQVGLGNVHAVQPHRARRHRRRRRPLRRHRRPRPADRRDPSHAGPRRRAGHRRLRQRLLPLDQRDGLQRHRGVAGPPQGRLLRQPVLHADPPDVHPAEPTTSSRSSR